jgi:hypothetical protein
LYKVFVDARKNFKIRNSPKDFYDFLLNCKLQARQTYMPFGISVCLCLLGGCPNPLGGAALRSLPKAACRRLLGGDAAM